MWRHPSHCDRGFIFHGVCHYHIWPTIALVLTATLQAPLDKVGKDSIFFPKEHLSVGALCHTPYKSCRISNE